MTALTPETMAAARGKLGLEPDQVPRSVAIIMDGNGRWARQRGLPRTAGHAAGAEVVPRIVTEAAQLDIRCLTLYSFSTENWQRPREEVQALMRLYALYLSRERETMASHNIRFRHVGLREGLPDSVLRQLDEAQQATSHCTGMYLCIAINYGSRAEVLRAVRKIARRVQAGEVRPDDIDERMFSDSLDTAGVPDPDLLIRTSGELRLSNFLLWQLSYAEFYVSDVYWPEFTPEELHRAFHTYAARCRRFGRIEPSGT
ncbi:MAG TPA: isoprenyl transferase [Phycisphaerae bacterium]|nr:isoprenyl transferase [Phycisphaerae bacterium]